MKATEYNGYSLFEDVEDHYLKTRNRAVVLFNIYDNHNQDGKLSPKYLAELVGYFRSIPEYERKEVWDGFQSMLEERGVL